MTEYEMYNIKIFGDDPLFLRLKYSLFFKEKRLDHNAGSDCK